MKTFNHAISHWVIGGGSNLVTTQQLHQLLPQTWFKLLPSVCGYHGGDSKMWNPLKREIHPLTKACATVWVVISSIGTASGHLVNLSMQVSKYVLPFDTGRGPTISTCTWSNLASGVAKVPRGVIVCCCTLVFWHWMHDCIQRRTSLLIFSHT